MFKGPAVGKGRCERGQQKAVGGRPERGVGLGSLLVPYPGQRPWKSWQDGLAWGQRPGLPDSGLGALASAGAGSGKEMGIWQDPG